MQRFHLTKADRDEASYWFPVGGRWAELREDAEAMRWWQPVREDERAVLLRNGNHAFMELKLRDGVIEATRFLEGAEAEAAVRTSAFRPGESERHVASAVFAWGRAIAEAKADRSARLLRELRGAPPDTARFDAQRRGVVEVSLGGDGTIRGHRWLVGADALAALDADAEATRWDVPALPGPVPARTREEARLYVAVNQGDPEAERALGTELEVLARTPEGPRRFRFAVQTRDDFARDYGPGTSPCLDPAVLVLFASRVEKDLPPPGKGRPENRPYHAARLRRAADALREAARFVGPGEEVAPLGIYRTRAAEFLRESQPERFRKDRLLAEAERLEALAASWSP